MWKTRPQHLCHHKGKSCLTVSLTEEFEHQEWGWGEAIGDRDSSQGYHLLSIGQPRSEATIQCHLP